MIFNRSNVPKDKTPAKWRAPLFVLPLLLALAGIDLLLDYLFGSSPGHLMIEIAVQGVFVTVAIFSLISIWLKYVREREQRLIENNELEMALHEHQHERQSRSSSFSENFKNYIDKEFDRWHLTPSERQIALLLLDGEDFKSIAAKRFTSEKTVRNQSRSIYEKSGLSGRAALAAHFLKILLHNEGDSLSPAPAPHPQNSVERSRSGGL